MDPAKAGHKKTIAIGTIAVALFLIAAYFFLTVETTVDTGPEPVPEAGPGLEKPEQDPATPLTTPGTPDHTGSGKFFVVEKQISEPRVFEYDQEHTGSDSERRMKDRLRQMGMEKSLDMILRSDESVKIGGRTVSMQEVLQKAAVEKHKIHETRITETEETAPDQVYNYGIYVVQPGDNIWNIHFNILKEYFASRGIRLSGNADEPQNGGYSSGVGKILKFSEIMVIIYNVIEEKIVQNIDLIEPLSKLVIYNMDDVLEMLSDIDLDQLDQIRFDGTTLWIPTPET
jgi:hypothetical protein